MKVSRSALKFILILVTLLAFAAMYFSAPVLQDPMYHQFADQRSFAGIPNCWNVITNLAFLVVGLIGLYKLNRKRLNIVSPMRFSYVIFFTSVCLVSFGSAYYHWQPDNVSLFWDRLPMTFVFMSLLSFVLGEHLSVSWGRRSLLPLLLVGLLSVGYWYRGELLGAGDLRSYVLVQFLPVILLLLLLLLGRPIFKQQSGYWLLFTAYIFAKLAEHLDTTIYTWTSGIYGGHALKHLLSAAGLYLLIIYFERRVKKYNKQKEPVRGL